MRHFLKAACFYWAGLFQPLRRWAVLDKIQKTVVLPGSKSVPVYVPIHTKVKWMVLIVVLTLLPSNGYASLQDWNNGRLAYGQKDYARAVAWLNNARKQQPNNPDVLFYLGLAYAKTGRYAEAKAVFDEVMQLTPGGHALRAKAEKNAALMSRAMVVNDKGASHATSTVLAKAEQWNAKATTTGQNYLAHVLHNGKVIHWDAARMPLHIYLEEGHAAGNWHGSYNQLVQRAFQQWSQASNGLLRFALVSTPEEADITVRWVRQLEHNRLGQSPFKAMGNVIVQSDVVLATHEPDGKTRLNEQTLYAIALHEIGHALGLQGHSPNPGDMMYYAMGEQPVTQLSQRDRNTLTMLYHLQADIQNASTTGQSVAQTRTVLEQATGLHRLLEQKQFAQAVQQGMAALQKYPNDPTLLSLTAAALLQARQPQQAVALLQRALRSDPSYEPAQRAMQALRQAGY